jgi:hypothetical protein
MDAIKAWTGDIIRKILGSKTFLTNPVLFVGSGILGL